MNMIDIVAKALFDREMSPFAPENRATTWDEIPTEFPEAYQRHLDEARTAINALREPSDAMLAAGVVYDDATYSTWIAMIDEALRDE